jgi:hypothetical protein
MAQYGFPKLTRALTKQKLRDADIYPLREADQSLSKLKTSFWLSIATVTAAIAAVSIFLYAPTPKAAQTKTSYKISVKMKSGGATETTGCGTIQFNDATTPSTVTFTPDNPEKLSVRGVGATRSDGIGTRTFDIQDVQSIDAC